MPVFKDTLHQKNQAKRKGQTDIQDLSKLNKDLTVDMESLMKDNELQKVEIVRLQSTLQASVDEVAELKTKNELLERTNKNNVECDSLLSELIFVLFLSLEYRSPLEK